MVIDLVHRCRAEYGVHEGCDPRNACTRLKLNIFFVRSDGQFDGTFNYENRTITINERRRGWGARYRFTVYHEIMHFLLEDDGELLEVLHSACGEDGELFRSLKEYACNVGAAEFLAPQESVRNAIERRGFSIDLIDYMSIVFKLSFAAASIHLGRCSLVPCYVIVCKYGRSRLRRERGNCLYVEYAASPHSVQKPLIAGTPIPEDHLFQRVWRRGTTESGRSYIPYQFDRRRPCMAEAKRIKERVYGILYWSE